MKKVLTSTIIKTLLILIFCLLMGTLLMIITFSIPTKKIKDNVYKSTLVLLQEGNYRRLNGEYENSMLDNYTDSIMLQNSIYEGKESIIDKSMNVYRFYSLSDNAIMHLYSVFTQNEELYKTSYGRYWHGYLLLLRPLLLLFTYSDIRILNMIFQPLLIAYVIYLLYKKNLKECIIPYIISIIVLNPFIIPLSMQFSTIFYLLNLSLIVLLKYNDKLKKKNNYLYYFLLVGIITNFFDFLTYPLVTLGIPLTLYFVLKEQKGVLGDIKDILVYSIIWGIGYFGMWLGKFSIGSILTKTNIFDSALEAFTIRVSFEAQNLNITPISIISKNINVALPLPIFILLMLLFAIEVFKYIKRKNQIKDIKIYTIIPYLIIGCMPFVWYIVLSNHSYIHSFFTYRILIIPVFSMLVLIFSLNGERKIKDGKVKKRE